MRRLLMACDVGSGLVDAARGTQGAQGLESAAICSTRGAQGLINADICGTRGSQGLRNAGLGTTTQTQSKRRQQGRK